LGSNIVKVYKGTKFAGWTSCCNFIAVYNIYKTPYRFNRRLISHQNIIDKAGFNQVLLDAWFSMEDECVSVWEAETLSLVYINEKGCKILGFTSMDDLKHNYVFQCFANDDSTEVYSEKVRNVLNTTGYWKDNVIFKRNDAR
jgi:hypothetical protein